MDSPRGHEFGGTPIQIPIVLPKVLRDVIDERSRQTIKWGVQKYPDGTGKPTSRTYEEAAKALNDYDKEHNETNWARILEEEFWEALATTNPKSLREELIQVAAVAVAWVEDLDTR